jgi:hypothetical protein
MAGKTLEEFSKLYPAGTNQYETFKTLLTHEYTDKNGEKKSFIDINNPVSVKDEDKDEYVKYTPLMIYAAIGEDKIVGFLIDHGADTKKKVGQKTALMLAAENTHITSLKLLLKKASEEEKKNALADYLEENSQESNKTIIELLGGDSLKNKNIVSVGVVLHTNSKDLKTEESIPEAIKTILDSLSVQPTPEEQKMENVIAIFDSIAQLPDQLSKNLIKSNPQYQQNNLFKKFIAKYQNILISDGVLNNYFKEAGFLRNDDFKEAYSESFTDPEQVFKDELLKCRTKKDFKGLINKHKDELISEGALKVEFCELLAKDEFVNAYEELYPDNVNLFKEYDLKNPHVFKTTDRAKCDAEYMKARLDLCIKDDATLKKKLPKILQKWEKTNLQEYNKFLKLDGVKNNKDIQNALKINNSRSLFRTNSYKGCALM